MILSAIAAIGKNREIGLQNKMLWHIKEDFQNFKKITMGHHILMGRKTFESINKVLPERTSLVLTKKDIVVNHKDVHLFSSTKKAMNFAQSNNENELFVIGGGEIYKELLPQCQRLYLSQVNYSGKADTFFPEYEHFSWKIQEERKIPASENSLEWTFKILEKILRLFNNNCIFNLVFSFFSRVFFMRKVFNENFSTLFNTHFQSRSNSFFF